MGWRFSDEKFMNFAKGFLRDAKIRGSIGVTGNQTISNYAALDLIQLIQQIRRKCGNSLQRNAQRHHRMEKTTQYNIG